MEITERIDAALRRRKTRLNAKRAWLRAARKIVGILLLYTLLAGKLFHLMQAPDNAMYPAIQAGDLVLSYRLDTSFEEGDVVVYEQQDGKVRLGRIVAVQGDNVTIDDSGILMVNGTMQAETVLFSTYPDESSGIQYPYTVASDCCFIMGDYRTESQDSRTFGAVERSCIQAKVITVLRRRNI